MKLPLIAVASVAALLVSSVAAAQSQPQPAPATAVVEQRTVADTYAADAVIEAVHLATISAQISGNVTQLTVDAGDRVRKGQLLARIDTRETDAQVASSRANVAQAEAALVTARLNFERTQSLLAQKFVSQSALDKAESDLKAAQAAVDAARAGATQATTSRSFAEVRSPIDGVVSRRLVELGELAAPGKPLMEIHDPNTLRATGAVPQFVLARVTQVSKATVVIPSLGHAVDSTRVTLLPASDPRLLSTQVRVDLPAGLPKGVVPGIAAKVLLPIGSASKLVMPSGAIVRRGELTVVYVVGPDGKPQLRQVRVGELTEAGQIEVLAGLAAGDRVQLNPLAK